MPRSNLLQSGVVITALGLLACPTVVGMAGAPVPGVRVTEQRYEDAMIAAIHHFAEQGEAEHLETLLEKYPKLVDKRQRFHQPRKPVSTDAYTALHWAARAGRANAAKVLLLHGADVHADAGGGWTPLHIAARYGDLDTVKLLVASGADTTRKTEAIPERNEIPPSSPPGARPVRTPAVPAMTPLDVAREWKRNDVIEFLKGLNR